MCESDAETGITSHLQLNVQRSPTQRKNVIDDEPQWRIPCQASELALSASKVVATRWHGGSEKTQEFAAQTPPNCHIVKIVLRSMNIRFTVSGHTVQDGVTSPGSVHVTEPAVAVRCLFRGPYDVLHLHVPNNLIAECTDDGIVDSALVRWSRVVPRKDITVDSLGRALLQADRMGGSLGQLYAECISVAIVARLLASASRRAAERPKSGELAQWRLKRAFEYVEARLDQTVTLADFAASVGLTRMHFAAQFKAATGLRPHEYLLRRRIERAQEMLVGTDLPLVDVALSVGFRNQAHFTSVFKRYAGQPPHAWRQSRTTGL